MDQLFGNPQVPSNDGGGIHLIEAQQSQQSQQQMTTPTAIMVYLQYGTHREKLILERSERPEAYADFFRKAQQLFERVVEEGLTPWSDSGGELLLFRHDYGSMNLLQRLTNLVELDNGSIVEIIRVSAPDQQKASVPHNVHVTSYKTPTFCDFCGEFLVGLIKQGVKCTFCNCNFHKKCAYAARNNCAKNETAAQQQQQQQIVAAGSATPTTPNKFAYELPHTLSVHNYTTPTVCKVCDKMLMGLIKQGMRCRDCKVNVHRKCAALLPKDCRVAENGILPLLEQMSVAEQPSQQLHEMGSVMDIDSGQQQQPLDMIPLARLPGSTNTTRSSQFTGALCEGWVIYFMLTEPSRRFKQYWVLDAGLISIYNEYNNGVNPSRVFKQIPLSEVMAIQPYEGKAIDQRYPPHCFEIRTRGCAPNSQVTYCVGENLHALAPKNSGGSVKKAGNSNWMLWYKALQQALQPPSFRTDPLNAEPALQFTQLYQIVREKVLGSGQFGTVFHGIHRQSSREVAVKVIAKDRFSKKPTASGVETLKSEVAILHAVDHPGIIKLESMFETKDKIFVVMEKMNGDMLEMILSQAAGRLDERSTRFLLMQILSALRYLHARGIAHCDLKPENVLLSNLQLSFPQTKLCDFGYARFIGDTQFRRTIVGTPAYMAPELLMKKGYNKSLDMWSIGVIIYVTLSGTFPFNDGEEIAEQIQNATFMFPPDLWRDINQLAIDLIQKLLRVEIEQRLNIDECMAHPFFTQDPQLYMDLRELEIRVNSKYLTTEQDDQRFQLPPFAPNLIF